ncbi:MAG TPA: CBS domain-containing protein, partial [Actinomycetota bacterium]|nr:CBS domain-containing protein [Actinomycetota bacterium]
LLKVSDIHVEDGPVVSPSDTVDEARRQMEKFDHDWVSVVEDGHLFGWVNAEMMEGVRTPGEAGPKPFSAYVTRDSTLRQALDSIVTSRTQVAVVASEGQRYLGILTLERISKEIVS